MKNKTLRPMLLYIASFAIPIIIIIVALAGLGITPFGDHTLVISDGDGLYINYLSYVGRVVRGQEGITYSFEKGLGGNMMDSWGWFLLNPFFAIFSLFDITAYPIAFTYVSALNFAACGFSMYILLRDIYGHKLSNILFSTSYALNGFLVANVFQMNFFTGVFALPLMVLGLRKIIQNKTPLLYVVTLAYSLFTNFYFGFMLCVASILIFAVNFFMGEIDYKKYVTVKYILSSILSGLISSVVWFPALLALRGGRLSQTSLGDFSFKEKMPFIEIFAKLFTGANSAAELQDGLPNIFVGILPVALVVLFFLSRNISREKKIKAGIYLGVYLVSFYIIVVDMLMHGGTVTNWFNFRYSFIFSFFLLLIASQEWQVLSQEPKSNFKNTALFLIAATAVIFSKKYEFINGSEILLDYIILSVIFLTFWMHKKDPVKNTKFVFEMIVLILISLNLFLNYRFCTKNIMDWGSNVSKYVETVMPVSSSVDAIKMTDDSFYRMEVGEQRIPMTGNNPMLYGYNGVSHGGSDDRNATRTALSQLGVHRYDMRNYYDKGIPAATDTLLGLKYIISKEDLSEQKGYEKVTGAIDWGVYKNNNALPVSFLANSTIEDAEIDYEDIFDNLNKTWAAISGKNENVFQEEQGEIIFSSHNIIDPKEIERSEAVNIVSKRDAELEKLISNSSPDADDQESGEENDQRLLGSEVQAESLKEPPENKSYIEYSWVASQDGPVYSYNRSGMMDDIGSYGMVLCYEGYYHKGDTITGYVSVAANYVTQGILEDFAGRFKAAYAELGSLEKLSREILRRPSSIEKVKDTFLRGHIEVDEGQLLMFTIPYDEGWTLTVDGHETELKQVLGAFMVAEVGSGQHVYELKFMPTGLKAGLVAASAALVVLLIVIIVDWKLHKKRKMPLLQSNGQNDASVSSENEAGANPVTVFSK